MLFRSRDPSSPNDQLFFYVPRQSAVVARRISAFAGSPIHGAETPDQLAGMVTKCLLGDHLRKQLRVASLQLAGDSTPAHQSEDLQTMYQYIPGDAA